MTRLTNPQILDAGLHQWRNLLNQLHGRFRTGSFRVGAEFVAAIAEAAEAAGHHPEVSLSYGSVSVTLVSHDAGGITQRDIDLARTLSQLADKRGIAAEPGNTQAIELALDTHDQSEIDQFWAAVLTGDPANVNQDTVTDPLGRIPELWFQESDASANPQQRFHLDITLPPEAIQPRTDAALAAGGHIAWETETFRVLEDRQGNRACLCWSEGRNEG